MTPEDAYAYLESFSEVDIEPGLDVMRAAMDLLADPQTGYRVVHVTGTNGKTSVAHMTAALLGSCGLRTGLFTSPHLSEFGERVEISGVALTGDVIAEQIQYLQPYFEEVERRAGRHPTYFEIGTTLAFNVFVDAVVDAAVIEVGLGGLYDATNIVDADVAVITNVSVDHENFLGSDPVEIAHEKAGIITSGSTVVTGVTEPEIIDVVESAAAAAGAADVWRLGDEIELLVCENAFGGVLVGVRTPMGTFMDIQLPLLGRHQGTNAALALSAAVALEGSAEIFTDHVVQSAFDSVQIPGRLELVDRRPLVVLDGAHNPAGARTLATAVGETFTYDRLVAVIGVLEDKDADGILEPLAGIADTIITTTPPGERGLPARDLAELATRVAPDTEVVAVESPAGALAEAREKTEQDDLILITGSIYLVGAIRPQLAGE